jgi:Flp pilus assembly protein TadB
MGLGNYGGDLPMARARLLEETKGTSFDTLSSPSLIVWYCFLTICVVVTGVCCCWHCGGRSRRQQYQLERMMARNEREETQQAERQVEISRIQANIKLFTEQQMARRRNALTRSLKRQRVVSLFNLCERTRVDRDAKCLLMCICCSISFDH